MSEIQVEERVRISGFLTRPIFDGLNEAVFAKVDGSMSTMASIKVDVGNTPEFEAEVCMSIAIYKMSKDDLVKLYHQIGELIKDIKIDWSKVKINVSSG